jgi:hypothetical protein
VSAVRSSAKSHTASVLHSKAEAVLEGAEGGSPSEAGSAPPRRPPPGLTRRSTLSNIRNIFEADDAPLEGEGAGGYEGAEEVSVLMVALRSPASRSEMVVARSPQWGERHPVPIARLVPGDEVIISMSNGGSLLLPYRLLADRAEDEIEFELAVQNVPLPSSVRMAIRKDDSLISPQSGASFSSSLPLRSTPIPRSPPSPDTPTTKKSVWWKNGEQSILVNILLSLLLMVAIPFRSFLSSSISSINQLFTADNNLAFTFSFALLFYNSWLLYSDLKTKRLSEASFAAKINTLDDSFENDISHISIHLLLFGHNFTSPDAPINEPDEGLFASFYLI